jgi:hypothetical protein
MRECAHLVKTEQPRDLGYMQLAVIEVRNCQIAPQSLKYFREVQPFVRKPSCKRPLAHSQTAGNISHEHFSMRKKPSPVQISGLKRFHCSCLAQSNKSLGLGKATKKRSRLCCCRREAGDRLGISLVSLFVRTFREEVWARPRISFAKTS